MDTMTTPQNDFNTLLRGTVGFDRIAEYLDRTLNSDVQTPGFPPYNIEKTDEDAYRITLAVAGFSEDELEIEQRATELYVMGNKTAKDDKTYLHRGISARSFRRKFHIADHVKVLGAGIENGLLNIDLIREIPEESRPRRIQIAAGSATKAAKPAEEQSEAKEPGKKASPKVKKS
jgi:molecular chaperone IbpA